MDELRYTRAFYEDGSLKWKASWLGQELHNEEFPAVVYYSKYGDVEWQYWYLHGVEYDEKEWSDLVFRKALEGEMSE